MNFNQSNHQDLSKDNYPLYR